MSDAHEHVRSGCVHALGHDGPCEVARGNSDAVLDGLVEKVRQVSDQHEFVRREVVDILSVIDAPSLVLLLREAREGLRCPDRGGRGGYRPRCGVCRVCNLIARIDTYLAPQPSTFPADV